MNRRDFVRQDPVEYFNEHYKETITSRTQLIKQDPSLYSVLKRREKLDSLLPLQMEFRDLKNMDLVRHFNENYAGKITSRKKLQKEDYCLYEALLHAKKLDEVLPALRQYWTAKKALALFKGKFQGVITTRAALAKENNPLYLALRKYHLLDKVLPNSNEHDRDFSRLDPVSHFNEKYRSVITTRAQLSKQDPVLYEVLRRRRKLDAVLPNTNHDDRDWARTDPVAQFITQYGSTISTRRELYVKDVGLYSVLLKRNLLDKVLPDQNKDHRDWGAIDPVTYFNEHHAGKIKTKKELEKQDMGLFFCLRTRKLLDVVFPHGKKYRAKGIWDLEYTIRQAETAMENEGWTALPSPATLENKGYSALISAIRKKHGGFHAFRQKLYAAMGVNQEKDKLEGLLTKYVEGK